MYLFLPCQLFYDKNNQVDINAAETVKEKITFLGESQGNLVVMKGNQNYNGLLNASEFMV